MIPILSRINELANKEKQEGLTAPEKAEQANLRKQYLQAFRGSVKSTLMSVTIVDPTGKDVTPEKLKKEQAIANPSVFGGSDKRSPLIH
jgi:uncharacterized protein YnzC (UPF0291/DUF896 family)